MILITGGTGVLGKELIKPFPDSIHPTHKELELSDKDRVLKFMQNNTIDVIIHAAALTGVRECEEDKSKAWKYNVTGTRSEEHTSELQSPCNLVCRLLLEKK